MMTEEEICREYRTAKVPAKQIQVLADLNATDRKTILKILVKNGEKVDGRLTRILRQNEDASPKTEDTSVDVKTAQDASPVKEGGNTHTHTHTGGGAPALSLPAYVTVQDLIVLLRDVPGECRVHIGERPLVGYAHTHGYNAITGEHLHVLQLIGGEEDV